MSSAAQLQPALAYFPLLTDLHADIWINVSEWHPCMHACLSTVQTCALLVCHTM
jgi:hypothetical protein